MKTGTETELRDEVVDRQTRQCGAMMYSMQMNGSRGATRVQRRTFCHGSSDCRKRMSRP